MLKELHISNYRLFDELHIPDLGQVNLIAGKNNTGKTALLEALRIWAAKGDSTVINHVLKNRGQFIPALDKSYDSLFKKRGYLEINDLSLGIPVNVGEGEGFGKEVYHITPPILKNQGILPTKKEEEFLLNSNVTPDFPQDQSIFIPFNGSNFPLQALWEKIVLTPRENDVLEILQLVELRIRRIDVKEENSRVLLEGNSIPVPLKSLGDGINRMLWVAVALVSAKESKLLLIDEFEAGLHHSVQEMLWEKIFFYAKKWEIQVFATTHSMDAVRTFFYVADKLENQGKGKFFRLQRSRKGPIEVIAYDHDRLEKMLELKMEPR